MKNCQEWLIAEMGLFSIGGTTVPIYDTLGEENVEYVLKQTACKTVVCRASEVDKVLACVKTCPKLKAVVIVGELSDRYCCCCCCSCDAT